MDKRGFVVADSVLARAAATVPLYGVAASRRSDPVDSRNACGSRSKGDQLTLAASHRLLWIDDQAELMKGLAGFLGTEGFAVEFSLSGAEGLRLAALGNYDAILLDFRLPDMPGLEVLKTLCSSRRAPVIVLTGYGTIESAMEAGQVGAAKFLCKPISAASLLQTIRDVVSSTISPAKISFALPSCHSHRTGRAPLSVTRLLDFLRGLGFEPTATLSEPNRIRLLCLAARAAADANLTLSQFAALVRIVRFTASRRQTHLASLERLRDRLELAPGRGSTQLERSARIVEFMEAGGPELIHLAKQRVAATFGLTSTAVTDLLRKEQGLSFRALRRFILMRRAVVALCASDEQVAQVAYALGYDHPSPFDRLFGRTFGMSPGEYRALLNRESSKAAQGHRQT